MLQRETYVFFYYTMMEQSSKSLVESIDPERVKSAAKWLDFHFNKPTKYEPASKHKITCDMMREKYKSLCSNIICEDGRMCVFHFDRGASVKLGYLFAINSITIDDGRDPIKMDVILPRIQDAKISIEKCARLSDDQYIVYGQTEYEVFMRILYMMNISSLNREDIEEKITNYNSKKISTEREMRELTSILTIQHEGDSGADNASTRIRRFTTVSVFARQRMRRAIESSENIDIVLRFMNKYSVND